MKVAKISSNNHALSRLLRARKIPLSFVTYSQQSASSPNIFLVCCYERDALLEIGHIISPLVLPIPLYDTVLINAIVATSLPPVAALSRPIPDALLLAQLVQVAQPSWREDVIEARNAEAVSRVCFSFGVDNDLEVGLRILRRLRQTGEPSVGGALIAMRDGDELDIGVCCCCVAQIEEGLLSDCSVSRRSR
jgi:hypothetical protein